MTLDGTISNGPAALGFLAIFVIGGNWIHARWNPAPPPEKYRKDGRTSSWIGFWNLFDESTFTPDAIEYHRRRLVAIPFLLMAFATGWLILDSIW